MDTQQLFYVSDADGNADVFEHVSDIESWCRNRRGVVITGLDPTEVGQLFAGQSCQDPSVTVD